MKEDKICGKCIYFDPVHKCSENVVGFTGYGKCLKDKKKICLKCSLRKGISGTYKKQRKFAVIGQFNFGNERSRFHCIYYNTLLENWYTSSTPLIKIPPMPISRGKAMSIS